MSSGLAYYRHCAGVSQARMAEMMGMPIRTYEDVEAGRSAFRPIHIAAANMAILQIAVEKNDLGILPMSLQEFARQLSALADNKKPAS